MSFPGPVSPRDSQTVLTRSFDAANDALKVVLAGGAGANSIIALTEAVRLATIVTPAVPIGGAANFTIVQADVADGNPIPTTIYCPQIVVVPSAATIFRVRLFGRATRLAADPIWYQYPFGAMNEDYANDATGFWYINRDAANPDQIFGEVAIDATGANAALFNIFLLFVNGR
jgi:hypothetical protein